MSFKCKLWEDSFVGSMSKEMIRERRYLNRDLSLTIHCIILGRRWWQSELIMTVTKTCLEVDGQERPRGGGIGQMWLLRNMCDRNMDTKPDLVQS